MTYHGIDNSNIYNPNYNRTVRDRWRMDNLERRMLYESRWRKKRVTCPHCGEAVGKIQWSKHMRTHCGFIPMPGAGELVWQ